MLTDDETLHMLEGERASEHTCPECDAAHGRGFQAGLRAAREPWVALFFGTLGFSAGFIIATLARG